MSTSVNIHILQTVPPSCLNRDDTGTPKTAIFGGVPRHRVSSQAWKRATRTDMRNRIADMDFGERTTHVIERVADNIQELSPEVERAAALAAAEKVIAAAGITLKEGKKKEGGEAEPSTTAALMFISRQELRNLAEVAVAHLVRGEDLSKKAARACLLGNAAVDIALFGRMLANAPELNVDAACQVAHAISVGKATVEFDYYTAMDDNAPEDTAGATMIDTSEFISSTLYRYANIDVDHFVQNVGSPEVAYRAIGEAIRSFVLSMPTGKQNAYAARTRPDCVLVEVRTDQPTSWVGAFESPIAAKAGADGVMLQAAKALLGYSAKSDDQYGTKPAAAALLLSGSLAGEVGAEVIGERTVGTLDEVIEAVVAAVSK